MAYPPGQSITVVDGNVGLASAGANFPIVMGTSELGTVDELYQFTNPNTVKSTLGQGPLTELVLPTIIEAGGAIALKLGDTVAGSAGSVTKTSVGSSTGTITVAGEPLFPFEVVVSITTSGTLGAGKFSYSLDDGRTTSPSITIPTGGTYAIPKTGLTLTFVPGAGTPFFEAGDFHEFDCTAKHYNTSDLSSGFTALQAKIGQTRRIRQIYLTGKHATAADAATMAAAFATHLTTLESADFYARGIMDAGTDTPAQVLTDFAAFVDDRVMLVYGDADIISLNAGVGFGAPKYPAMNAVAERYAGADLSENANRLESGSLRGVLAISHDEHLNQGFTGDDKITTLRTHPGQAGFYVTNGFLRSPIGSDFKYYDWGRVIDELCEAVYRGQQRWLGKKLRAKTDGTGAIDPRDAVRVEAAVRAYLKKKLRDPINIEGFAGHVSDLNYVVDQTTDFLASGEFYSTANAVPLVNVDGINTQVGFARTIQ